MPWCPTQRCIKLTCKVVLAVQDIALVEPRAGPLGTDTLDAVDLTPRHCVLLRAGGLMSLLDMDKGQWHACRHCCCISSICICWSMQLVVHCSS